MGFRGGCTSDRFQPGFWVIGTLWLHKSAGKRDLVLGALALGAVKSVIRATQAGSECLSLPTNRSITLLRQLSPPFLAPPGPCDPAAAPALCGKIRSWNCISIGRR